MQTAAQASITPPGSHSPPAAACAPPPAARAPPAAYAPPRHSAPAHCGCAPTPAATWAAAMAGAKEQAAAWQIHPRISNATLTHIYIYIYTYPMQTTPTGGSHRDRDTHANTWMCACRHVKSNARHPCSSSSSLSRLMAHGLGVGLRAAAFAIIMICPEDKHAPGPR